jgi:phosphoribosylglycinamide formyltransferase-1
MTGTDAQNRIEDSNIKIAIFASGAGSNAEKIINYFSGYEKVKITLLVCNKPDAGVISIAEAATIPVLLIEKEQFFRGDAYVEILKEFGINLIVLAGFLWKVPKQLIAAFPDKIINIHPALLPNYGGKGMYGHFVHEAVIANEEKESGITIHFVNENFDEGKHIFQASCPVLPKDTPETLAARIHQLEHAHFAPIIETVIKNLE